MNKYRLFSMLFAISCFGVCLLAGCNHTRNSNLQETITQKAETIQKRNEQSIDSLSREVIQNAFQCILDEEVNEEVSDNAAQQFKFRYSNADAAFVIAWDSNLHYPVYLYQFKTENTGKTESKKLASQSDLDKMTQAAKRFIRKVCEVDCSKADVQYYSYQGRIGILLDEDDTHLFHVQFVEGDPNVVGYQFFSERTKAESFYQKQGAVVY